MSELWRLLRDPRVSSTLVLAAGVVVGFAVLGLGWRGVAGLLFVPLQLPYLVSGALLGVAVVGASLGLLAVHLDRVEAAEERRAVAALQREVLRQLTAASRRATARRR